MTAGPDTQITELAVGEHACLTFGDSEELLDLTAAFIRDGLAAGAKALWVTGMPPVQAEPELSGRGVTVDAALACGQLATVAWEDSLLCEQGFVTERAVGWLCGQLTASRDEGRPGLRVVMDMGWALRPVPGIEHLPEFEKSVAEAVSGTGTSVLCQYDRERFDPVTLASVAGCHSRSVAAATYHADALLRICRQYAPPGIRLAGEIDYGAEEQLALALAEAIRLGGDIAVNMRPLRFIDVCCARMIIDAARLLAAPRKVVLQCSTGVARTFSLLAAAEVPGVSVVTADDR